MCVRFKNSEIPDDPEWRRCDVSHDESQLSDLLTRQAKSDHFLFCSLQSRPRLVVSLPLVSLQLTDSSYISRNWCKQFNQ